MMVGACTIVVLMSYHYWTLYILYLLKQDSTQDKTVVYANAVLHSVLVFMIFWSLLTTYLTDPGYVRNFFSTL
jgi:hypothetical protein